MLFEGEHLFRKLQRRSRSQSNNEQQ